MLSKQLKSRMSGGGVLGMIDEHRDLHNIKEAVAML